MASPSSDTPTTVHCPSCGFAFVPDEHDSPPAELIEALPAPKGMTVATEGGGLVIRRRWFSPSAFFLLGFAVFWDGFLVVWYTIALSGALGGDDAAAMALLFPLLHVAAGVGITWLALATLLNTTKITLRSGELSVEHGPVPWKRPPTLKAGDLEQLWVVEKRGNKGGRSYQLHARTRQGVAHKLVSGLQDVNQARFLERRLEAALGIRDRKVQGEYRD